MHHGMAPVADKLQEWPANWPGKEAERPSWELATIPAVTLGGSNWLLARLEGKKPRPFFEFLDSSNCDPQPPPYRSTQETRAPRQDP